MVNLAPLKQETRSFYGVIFKVNKISRLSSAEISPFKPYICKNSDPKLRFAKDSNFKLCFVENDACELRIREVDLACKYSCFKPRCFFEI